MKGDTGSLIVYQTPEPIRSIKIYSFFENAISDFTVSLSSDGSTYAPLKLTSASFFAGKENYDYYVPVLYTARTSDPDANTFLKIEYGGPAQISRIEIRFSEPTAAANSSAPNEKRPADL
ncbi:MAG: hypothetical protein LLF76_10735 [Planctomycetaceae bacterium]|nr:hypothetical protein [Planctomycetaceae bacterium]